MTPVYLFTKDNKLIGVVRVKTNPFTLRLIKVRFEGEVSGGPKPLFEGERFFVQSAEHWDRYYDRTDDGTEFVQVSDIKLAEPDKPKKV